MTDILELRNLLRDLEETKKQLENDITQVKADLFKAVAAENDSFSAADGYITKVVRPVRKSYDWDTIKERVGALKFKKIVKQVPDETLLTEAIAKGEIKIEDIAGCVTEKATTPYVRTYEIRDFNE